MSDSFIKINTLSVSKNLADFVKNELLPGLDVKEKDFWDGFDKSINELAPINKKLLEVRETLQSEIDLWLKKNRNGEFNHQEYKNFLKEIGYLQFIICTGEKIHLIYIILREMEPLMGMYFFQVH